MQIGTFTRNDDGFFGDLRTLTLHAKFSILPVEKAGAENVPDYRVLCEGTKVGAAWERTGGKAGPYLSVVIDDPSLSQPIRAILFQSGAERGTWTLHWRRQYKRDERS